MNYLGKLSLATAEVCKPLKNWHCQKLVDMEQHILVPLWHIKVIIKKMQPLHSTNKKNSCIYRQMTWMWVSELVFCKWVMECVSQ